MLQALNLVIRREGVLSLWKGNAVTIIHRLPYSSINFCTYELTSELLQQRLPQNTDAIRRLLAGATAGLVACSVAYPLDLVRTRLAAQTGDHYYHGVLPSLRRIVADEGARGLYRGLGATLAQVVPSLAINFTVYETAKAWCQARSGGSQLSSTASLACGCAAGLASSTLTFPLDVLRRRLQVQRSGATAGTPVAARAGAAPSGLGYREVVRQMRAAGLRGCYTGILPEYCKVLPGVAIAFCTYEKLKQSFGV